MKDTTKHIIAKEILFFFKWLLIGAGVAFVLFLPLLIAECATTVPRWLKDSTAVVVVESAPTYVESEERIMLMI